MLLFGKRGITALKYISQDALGGLDTYMPHVNGDPRQLELFRPTGFFSVIGKKLPASSPGKFDDVPAFLFRWWFSPEDSQVDVGGAVGISPGDRTFYDYGCYFWVGTIVWRELLCQSISPNTCFLIRYLPLSIG